MRRFVGALINDPNILADDSMFAAVVLMEYQAWCSDHCKGHGEEKMRVFGKSLLGGCNVQLDI